MSDCGFAGSLLARKVRHVGAVPWFPMRTTGMIRRAALDRRRDHQNEPFRRTRAFVWPFVFASRNTPIFVLPEAVALTSLLVSSQ